MADEQQKGRARTPAAPQIKTRERVRARGEVFTAPREVSDHKHYRNSWELVSSQGIGYIDQSDVLTNLEIGKSYKVMITRVMAEHAGEPDKDGQFGVLATVKVLFPNTACTDSYIVGGCFDNERMAKSLCNYLKSKFVRFLILQAAASINLSKSAYQFVPLQDFSKPWTDAELYKKYKLTKDEIAFIESMIKPME